MTPTDRISNKNVANTTHLSCCPSPPPPKQQEKEDLSKGRVADMLNDQVSCNIHRILLGQQCTECPAPKDAAKSRL